MMCTYLKTCGAFLLAAIMLLGGNTSYGQIYVLEGRTISAIDGQSVPDALLSVVDRYTLESIIVEKSDANGNFSIRIPASERIQLQISGSSLQERIFSFRDLNELFLQDDHQIQLFPKGENHYAYQIQLPEIPKQPVALTIFEHGNDQPILETMIKQPIYTVPRYFVKNRSYRFELQAEGYFDDSWMIEMKKNEELVHNRSMVSAKHDWSTVSDPESSQMPMVRDQVSILKKDIDAIITIEGLAYRYGESYITPASARALDQIISLVKENPGILFELGDHSKEFGDSGRDLELSIERAQVAVDYLVEKAGLPSERLGAKGYGSLRMDRNCSGRKTCEKSTVMLPHSHQRTTLKVIAVTQPVPARTGKTTKGTSGADQGSMQSPSGKLQSGSGMNNAEYAMGYSGKAIQILFTQKPLPKGHPVRTDDQILEWRRQGDGYAYLVIPDQAGQEDLSGLLTNWREKYNDAFVVTLKDGKRLP